MPFAVRAAARVSPSYPSYPLPSKVNAIRCVSGTMV